MSRSDRWNARLVPAAFVLALVTIAGVALILRLALEQDRDDALASCRAVIRTETIEVALERHEAVRDEGQALILEGLAAAAAGDRARLLELQGEAMSVADRARSSGAARSEAREEYLAAVRRSQRDTDEFLRNEC